MFKRPSSRRKSKRSEIILNLVPVLDAMVTLISFLLFSMSFFIVVTIESPFPQASQKDVEQKLKEKPLQLTVTLRENQAEVWSPFERIRPKTIPNTAEKLPDIKTIHETLVSVKQQFPLESKIVFVPFSSVNYDTMIAVMDSMRTLEPSDPPVFVKNSTTGIDESVKTLFPEVIFGNLLGDS